MTQFSFLQNQPPEYIEDWLIIGPFRGATGSAELSEDYLHGETVVVPSAGDPRLNERPWTPAHAPGGRYSFLQAEWPFTDYAVAYAHVYVHSPAPMECRMVVGSDDGIAVFLNGEQVFVCDINRAWNPEQDRFHVQLQQGWNRVLLKIRNGAADWLFSARFADDEGRQVPSLEYRLDNPDPLERFGIPMRYADLQLQLSVEQIQGDVVKARMGVANLGDYEASDVRLVHGEETLWEKSSLTGGASAATLLDLRRDELAQVVQGGLLQVYWQTGSEYRRAGVEISRPEQWILALGKDGVAPFDRPEAEELARLSAACSAIPRHGPELSNRAAAVLRAGLEDPEKGLQEARSARQALEALGEELKSVRVHLVAQSHIDMAWLWDWQETRDVVFPLTFRRALEMIGRHEDYVFTQNQPLGLATVEETHPELFRDIAEQVRAGRWVTTGGQWLEPDTNMVSGESLVRHALYGQRYIHSRFGSVHSTGWCVDNFGHCWTLPQILRRAGIRNYLFGRCGKGYPVFWWEGPDGSRVLAAHMRHGLPGPQLAEEAVRTIQDYGLHQMMFVFGGGDHGGGATDEDIALVRQIQNDELAPDVRISGGQEFFDSVRAESGKLPVVREELNFQFPGCWTSQGRMKVLNRRLENTLFAAEVWASLASLGDLGWRPQAYPAADLERGWKTLLLNQFHDILPGSGIHEVHEEAEQRYAAAILAAEDVLRDSAQRIACGPRQEEQTDNIAVAVFNPLSWTRADAVEVDLDLPAGWKSLVVSGEHGKEWPAQIVDGSAGGRARIVFVAHEVPACGYRVFHIRRGKASSDVKASQMRMGNGLLDVGVDGATGSISSLMWQGQEMLAGPSNYLLAHEDTPPTMAAWELGLTGREAPVEVQRVDVVENGPVRCTMAIRSGFGQSTFEQRVSLYDGLDRLDCSFRADWMERNVLLAAHFQLAARPDSALYEIPYGWVERRATGQEMPALNWVLIRGMKAGLALLNNGRHGFNYRDGALSMSVLRGPTDPDPHADEGAHEVGWALLPHAAARGPEYVSRRAREFNAPLVGLVLVGRQEAQSRSLLQVDCEAVEVGALKRGEDSQALVVRLVETAGDSWDVHVTTPAPPVEVREVNLTELDGVPMTCSESGFDFHIGPFEIRTFSMRFPDPQDYHL